MRITFQDIQDNKIPESIDSMCKHVSNVFYFNFYINNNQQKIILGDATVYERDKCFLMASFSPMRSLENDKENARRKGIGIRAKLLMVEELKKVIYGRNDALSAYSFFHDSEDMSGENAQFLGALKINTDEEVPFEQYYLKTKEYYENKMTARQKLQGHNKTKSQ